MKKPNKNYRAVRHLYNSRLHYDESLGQGSRPGQLNSTVDVLITITIIAAICAVCWLLNRYSIINIF